MVLLAKIHIKKKKTEKHSNAALEVEHPPPGFPSISGIRLPCKNCHIHK